MVVISLVELSDQGVILLREASVLFFKILHIL